jgi:lipid-binding SYLF domain-containing protein
MWEAVTVVECIPCRGLLLHTLMGLWSTQANVDGTVLMAAWHWGSDSSVTNDPVGEPGCTALYAGLPTAWVSVDSDCIFSLFSLEGSLIGDYDRYQ